ncbi:MAG: hypothetical protein KJ556_20070 [Gammaproteobacteria bacterium]|nr:hypothetical protein [Gammaproteobacteria bacterium]MBU2249914.1 hypothetical protein [Gammaproteobacteria bacterium]
MSKAEKLSRLSKAELVERVKELERQTEDEADSSASPLYEIRSLVNYTQFFPRPEGKPDVMVSPRGVTPLPEEMLPDKNLRRAIADGKLTEPYKVEAYSLPPKELKVPAELELLDPRAKQAVQNILAGTELGESLITMEVPKGRKGRLDKAFLEDTLLPILRNARWLDDHTHEMPEDLRKQLDERIGEIEKII